MARAASFVLVATGIALVVGVPVPMGAFRGTIAARLGEAMGADVEIEAIGLRIGVQPRLRVEGLRIQSKGPDGPGDLEVKETDLQVGLAALLGRRIHVVHARVDGVSARLSPAPPADEVGDPPPRPERDAAGVSADAGIWPVDVGELSVTNVEIAWAGGDQPIRVRLDELRGSLDWEDRVVLSARASAEEIPLSLEIEGASMQDLLNRREAWPLSLRGEAGRSRIELSTALTLERGRLHLGDLQGSSRMAELRGWLEIEMRGERPGLRGVLDFGEVDLGPALALAEASAEAAEAAGDDEPEADAHPGESLPPPSDGPGPFAAAVKLLQDFETDLQVSVERIAGIDLVIEDVHIAATVVDGSLDFPIGLSVASIPLEGTLGIEEVGGLPAARFVLGAKQFRIEPLGAFFAPEAEVRGGFDTLELEVEGRGDGLLEFLTATSLALRASGAALTYGADGAVPFGVDELELGFEAGGPLRLDAGGSVLGESVRVELASATVEELLVGRRLPIQLSLAGAGASLALEGEIQGHGADQPGSNLSLRGSAERLADLEAWTGPLPVGDVGARLGATLETQPGAARLRIDELRLGEMKLTGDVAQEEREAGRFRSAHFEIETLDLNPLLDAQSEADEPAAAPYTEAGGYKVDVPIVPGGISFGDGDLSLRVGSLLVGASELEDVKLTGSFRDHQLVRSPFGFVVEGTPVDGVISADLRAVPHDATFELGARDVDVGGLLGRLGVVEGIVASVSELDVELVGHGSTLGQLISKLDVRARLLDARTTLVGVGDVPMEVVLERGELVASGTDEPATLEAVGSLKGLPIELGLSLGKPSALQGGKGPVPLALRVEFVGASLALDSQVSLPIGSELRFDLSLDGERLDAISPLVGFELPPLGPYHLAGRLDHRPDLAELSGLDVRLGDSRLGGGAILRRTDDRLRLDVDLTAPLLQLDDVLASDTVGTAAPRQESAPEDTPSEAPRIGEEQAVDFFTPEGLREMDGSLSLNVERVLSGDDVLGRGVLEARLDDGHFEVETLDLALPGGDFHLDMGLAYLGGEVEARIRAATEKLDYGILARRIDPDTEMSGWITLDLDIAGRAPIGEPILAHSSGRLDFFGAPENIETGVLDLWAVNLLSFLVPRLDSSSRSKLNCLVVRFDLDRGLMGHEALLLDTTTMVVQGEATIDFRKETIDAVLVPRPKRPQMLSLQTAVGVSGSFDDFGIGVAPQDLLATVVRMAASVVTVPLQWVFVGTLPRDGMATCEAAWNENRE